jgi:hypothetical protein
MLDVRGSKELAYTKTFRLDDSALGLRQKYEVNFKAISQNFDMFVPLLAEPMGESSS